MFRFRDFPFRRNNKSKEFRTNDICFVRKAHQCGKVFEGSKSCFIACPSDQSIKMLTDLLGEKLAKYGIETIVAVEERAYGQDIFCTKICGKIIESKFCIVILDDIEKSISPKKNELLPNPNVYYEYGLMTALGKHIIPLQKEGSELAFNIQSYDTIKYNGENIKVEAERAIKDAIKKVEEKEKNEEEENEIISYRSIERKLELHRYKKITENDEFFENLNDTVFDGYYNIQENNTLLLTRIEIEESISDIIDDIGVIILRINDYRVKINSDFKKRVDEIINENRNKGIRIVNLIDNNDDRVNSDNIIKNLNKQLNLCNSIIFGFINNDKIDINTLTKYLEKKVAENPLFSYSIQEGTILTIKGIKIDFEEDKQK